MSAGLSAFTLAFELSPIILVSGGASLIPGGMLPIMAITEAINLPLGLLSGGSDISTNDFFAHYSPLPGASMIDQDIAQYPFANQTVAANAVVTKPLQVSFEMIVPAKGTIGYFAKLPIMMALQAALEYHNSHGGVYTLLTPSFIYTNCVMLSMRDTSTAATKQVQNTWQLDFIKPLLTVNDAQAAEGSLNGLMQQLNNGTQVSGQPLTAGLQSTAGSGLPATPSAVTPIIGTTNPVGVSTATGLPASLGPSIGPSAGVGGTTGFA
jgi:hypothetical protein